MVIKFDFTKRDIVMMAAFLALLFVAEVVWVLGMVIGNIVYPIVFGAILIITATVIGKKYSILIIGIVLTIINLSTAHLYGGTLAALAYLTGAIALEGVLQLSKPYGGNRTISIVGAFAYGVVSRLTYVGVIVLIYGMVLPIWAIVALIAVPLIPYAIGGLLGYQIGVKVKGTVESV
jgi:hypothetical protein